MTHRYAAGTQDLSKVVLESYANLRAHLSLSKILLWVFGRMLAVAAGSGT